MLTRARAVYVHTCMACAYVDTWHGMHMHMHMACNMYM